METKQIIIRWEKGNGTEKQVLDLYVKDFYEAVRLNSDNFNALQAFRTEVVWLKWEIDSLMNRLQQKEYDQKAGL